MRSLYGQRRVYAFSPVANPPFFPVSSNPPETYFLYGQRIVRAICRIAISQSSPLLHRKYGFSADNEPPVWKRFLPSFSPHIPTALNPLFPPLAPVRVSELSVALLLGVCHRLVHHADNISAPSNPSFDFFGHRSSALGQTRKGR